MVEYKPVDVPPEEFEDWKRGHPPSRQDRLGLWKSRPKHPDQMWRDGLIYYSLPALCCRRDSTPGKIRYFAESHPELTIRVGRYLYCRDECPGPRYPDSVTRDGLEYFRTTELARRRNICSHAARRWALRHPHLTIRIGSYYYARDEEWRPKQLPAYIWRNGLQHFSARELARRRGVTEDDARRWAQRHPHLALWDGPHIYARDEEWRPLNLPPYIFRDGHVFYSLRELARRRGSCDETARTWAIAHPHLTTFDGKFRYVRDEEWTSKDPDYVAPPAPVEPQPELPIYIKTLAARRRR